MDEPRSRYRARFARSQTATVIERGDGLPSSERVYRRMKEMIISGELAPHTRLVELQFAAEFGVSRTPVREALKRLTADKLVNADPVRGLVVHEPEPHEIQEVYLVREVLEGLATRLAAQRITDEEIQRLRAILDSMHEGLQSGRTDMVVNANMAFHDVIYRAAGNATLSRLARDLSDLVRRFSREAFSSGHRVSTVFDEHEAILAALGSHDVEAADAASMRHLRAASEYMTHLHVRQAIEGRDRQDS
jgi:DNA-binding GntR family transcriptional regulator